MSTQKDHKVLNLYREQITAYQTARAFALAACGENATEGELLEEIATAYIDQLHTPEADCSDLTICSMVDETAADNGDPTFAYDELSDVHGHVLDKLAVAVDSEEIDSFATNMEILAYFCCPAKKGRD